jgi:cellulose synthase/poly-beta-1,6-N-acetylglucosamine synthase-like glycosyltransferase
MSFLQMLVTVSVLTALLYLAVVSVTSVVAALRVGGRREDSLHSSEALAASPLTMPVSIVVPVGGSTVAGKTIEQILGLAYPEFEVIAVVDAGQPETSALIDEWQLESREFFYRRTLDTAPVLRIFRSLRDARLMVVEKEQDRRSDALNCGVNLARYRFVAVVPPGTTFDRTALLRAMAPALRDPVSIVGVASQIERVPDAGTSSDRTGRRYQHLRSIRSLMFARLFWGRTSRSLSADGGVVIWQRDAVLQASGFSNTAIDADLDLMLRLQQPGGGEDRRFVRSEDAFGQAATLERATLQSVSRRRQRAALQTIASLGRGVGASLGTTPLAYFLESELITPIAQLWIVMAAVLGAAAGWFTWTMAILTVLLLSFGTAVVSAVALLLRGAHPLSPGRDELRALLLLAPLEIVLYRPIHTWSRLAGVFSSGPDRS